MLRSCNAPLRRCVCACVCVFQLTLTTFCRLTADLRRWRRCGHRALICYRVTVPAKQLDLRISSHPPAYSFFKLFSTINYSWHLRPHRVSICIQRPPHPMIPWTPPPVFVVCCSTADSLLADILFFFNRPISEKVWNPLNFFPQPKRIHCSIYTLIITRSKWHSADVMQCHLCPEPWIKKRPKQRVVLTQCERYWVCLYYSLLQFFLNSLFVSDFYE